MIIRLQCSLGLIGKLQERPKRQALSYFLHEVILLHQLDEHMDSYEFLVFPQYAMSHLLI